MTERQTGRGVLRLVSDGSDSDQPGESEASQAGFGGGAVVPSLRLLIGHAHGLVRAGYRAWLESEGRIEVVAEASSCEEAIELCLRRGPHVALADLSLADFDGPAMARMVGHPALAEVAVILMAPEGSDTLVYDGLLAGAVGVVEREVVPHELILAVHVVARGGALLPAAIARRLLAWLPAQSPLMRPPLGRLGELTSREREIVRLVARGLSNSEIASLLVVSPKTIKTHVSRAMVKLGARHRAQLVVLAYETGLVTQPPLEDGAPGVDDIVRESDRRTWPAAD